MKRFFLFHRFITLYIASLLSIVLGAVFIGPGEAKASWQEEWARTVKAAKKEGQLAIAPIGSSWYPVFREVFQKKYPRIKVTMLPPAGPGAVGQRVVTERRAEEVPSGHLYRRRDHSGERIVP